MDTGPEVNVEEFLDGKWRICGGGRLSFARDLMANLNQSTGLPHRLVDYRTSRVVDWELGPRQPLLVACRRCEHVWPILWMRCDASLINKATPKCCPWCGNTKSKEICIASRGPGDLDRYAVWLAAELQRAREDAATPPIEFSDTVT